MRRLPALFLLGSVAIGYNSGCSSGCNTGAAVTPAEVVFTGGTVYTMETTPSVASDMEGSAFVAVTGGRIVAVSSADDAAAHIGPDTRVEDLAGGVLFPGFTDAHMHLAWGGVGLELIQLSDATSTPDLLRIVTEYATSNPEDAWLQGGGWDAPTFEGLLHRAVLDAVVADRPVYLLSADGHSVWVNSAALAAAGITACTRDPAGGSIERDEAGDATGVLRETAVALVDTVLPATSAAQIDAGIRAGSAAASAVGITTIIDANTDVDGLDGYLRAEAAGTLTVRVHAAVEADPARGAHQIANIAALRTEYASDLVHVDGVKLYFDGVIESQTAFLVDPYADGNNGEQLFTDARIDELFAAADAEGLQIHVHAIGDAAIRQLLDGVERLAVAHGAGDRRPLAAHIELIQPIDVPRFAELGVYADFQPLWAYPDSYITELTVPVIGADRAEWLYPIGDIALSGATFVAGSDWDVSSQNPFEAIEVAVTRQDPDVPGDILTVGQRVSVGTILAAYTRDGARAVFREEELGTITAGKLAELVILDRDPFAVASAALSDVQVRATFLGGVAVYRAE